MSSKIATCVVTACLVFPAGASALTGPDTPPVPAPNPPQQPVAKDRSVQAKAYLSSILSGVFRKSCPKAKAPSITYRGRAGNTYNFSWAVSPCKPNRNGTAQVIDRNGRGDFVAKISE